MIKSRSIRIAVNLCVTVALLLPGSSFGNSLTSPCELNASSEAKCKGCGHCSVSSPGQRCGCCCKKKDTSHQESGCQSSSRSLAAKKNNSGSSQGVCLCKADKQPAIPASQCRSLFEQILQLRHFASTSLSASAADAMHSCTMEGHCVPTSLLPRDSQRLLCVWRI